MRINAVLDENFFDLYLDDQITILNKTKVVKLPAEFGGATVKVIEFEHFLREKQINLYLDNESPNVVVIKNGQFLWGNTR